MHCFNIDDYHSIHEWRRPNSTSLSSATHMATCISKKIENVLAVPANYNNIPLFNPKNIEASTIIYRLINDYKGRFDLSYNYIKKEWIQNEMINENDFDQLELLSVHLYDANIEERKEERSMKTVRILDIKEQNLRSLEDYLSAIKMITDIKSLVEYIKSHPIPVIADFPGQLFIRKIITLYLKNRQNNIQQIDLDCILNFIPILGPLHVSLNSRENVVLLHHDFFKKLYCNVFEKTKFPEKPKPWKINYILQFARDGWLEISNMIVEKFGKTKDTEYRMMIDLLDNIIPATLDIYAVLFRSGAFEQYLETIFRIWTFFLRWNRKNYKKLPLVFLSDYFYWKNNNHPFAKLLENSLVNFNDYFVENVHSRIRAQTHRFSSAESIIQETFIIDSHKNESLTNAFSKSKRYPYTPAALNYLKKKTSCFLIEYFSLIYRNLNKSQPVFNKKKLIKYKLCTLDKIVDIKLLPAGYHTAHPPKKDKCDYCDNKFDPNLPECDGEVLICGHSYHYDCLETLEKCCGHCTRFYEDGIVDNVASFLKTLEKDDLNILENNNENDRNCEDDNDDDQESIENININEEVINRLLTNAKNEIKNW